MKKIITFLLLGILLSAPEAKGSLKRRLFKFIFKKGTKYNPGLPATNKRTRIFRKFWKRTQTDSPKPPLFFGGDSSYDPMASDSSDWWAPDSSDDPSSSSSSLTKDSDSGSSLSSGWD